MSVDRCTRLLLEIRRQFETECRRIARAGGRPQSLLDVGCWNGEATDLYRRLLGGPAFGIELFPAQVAQARARGIEVAAIDLERQDFPWDSGSMDVVTCNQVFEHLKNIWRPMSEIARVLRPGGWLVFAVPNLAALHNRIALLFGHQPTTIRVPGPHVRAYTLRQTRSFLETGGVFRVERVAGVGTWRYGFGAPLSRLLAGLSHCPVIAARKVGEGAPWLAFADNEQTHYEGLTRTPGERHDTVPLAD